MGFVFELNVDLLRDRRCERLEVPTVVVVADVGVWRHPDRIDNPIDDAPAAGFQSLLRSQQDLAGERIDCLMTLNTPEFGVTRMCPTFSTRSLITINTKQYGGYDATRTSIRN